jgi:hypothetical protein
MQEQANEQTTPTLPTSQPGAPVSMVETSENDDDPDVIFMKAVAEIDTQPLAKVKPRRTGTLTIADVLEIGVLVSVLCFGLLGSAYLALTYPHTLVILYVKEQPASITVALDLATRPLAPITLTRSQTAPTTGAGHQNATQAGGQITFYNGSFTSKTIDAGTLFTAIDGIQVMTNETITIPPGNPPTYGEATVPAHAVPTGRKGNINAGAINTTVSSDVLVKNSQFTGGSNARDFQAVAQADLDNLTTATTQLVNQQILLAFILRPGETVHETSCTTKTATDHAIGAEAHSVTLTIVKTCAAIAYNRQQLESLATAAFTQTRPGVNYHLIGGVLTSLHTVSPLFMTIHGKWVYTFTPDYQQYLAEKIAGATPFQARKVLLQTGVISYASVPNTLPPAGFIDFLVLTEI